MIKNNVGVIGAGTMGNGIAHVFALSNNINSVNLIDINESILDSAKININKNLKRQISKGTISTAQADKALNKIIFSSSFSNLRNPDIVVEAVKEDLKIKHSVFKKLNELVSHNTILATNTSSISINQISKVSKYPQNVIGMHFMNPVPVMRLVEIIKCNFTDKSILKRTINYVSSLNKIPIECNDSPGFVSNRILMPLINEAAFTYMEKVAKAEAIDEIMKLGMGHPMGPLKLADLIGLDVCVSIMEVLFEGFKNEKYKACPLLKELVVNNKLGVKTGEGFYKY